MHTNTVLDARPDMTFDSGSSTVKLLTFHLGNDDYAVNIMKVREIFEYGDVTPMPMMPEFIQGAINLRGKTVPVIDLARRMNQGQARISARTCMIIVEVVYQNKPLEIGVIVDAVNRVIDIRPADIDQTPDFGGKIRADFIEGLGKIDGRFVVILNMQQVLSLDDLALLSQSISEPAAAEGTEPE